MKSMAGCFIIQKLHARTAAHEAGLFAERSHGADTLEGIRLLGRHARTSGKSLREHAAVTYQTRGTQEHSCSLRQEVSTAVPPPITASAAGMEVTTSTIHDSQMTTELQYRKRAGCHLFSAVFEYMELTNEQDVEVRGPIRAVARLGPEA